MDNTDFHVEKNITAASASSGGTEVGVEVTYEPSRLGDTRATLTVFSPVGGEYVFPLFGLGLSRSCSATFEQLFGFGATFSPSSNFSDFEHFFPF